MLIRILFTRSRFIRTPFSRLLAAIALSAAAPLAYSQAVSAPAPGTPNVIPVFSGAATLANSNLVNVNGFIGVGTTTPDAPLSVFGVGTTPMGYNAVVDLSGSSNERVRFAIGNTSPGTSHSSAMTFYSGKQATWEIGTDLNYTGDQTLYIWDGHTGQLPIFINPADNVGIGTTTPSARLDVAGNILAEGTVTIAGQGGLTFSDGTVQSTAFTGVVCGGDYAESVDVTGDRTRYEPGDLLVIDPAHEGHFLKSAEPYSTSVTGIYSTRPGVIGRRQLTDRANMKDEVPMAMTGIVPTKVTAENGAIHPGDLLVTSSRLGYAMKGTDRGRMLGAVIGKALGHLDSSTGTIEVVVTLQ